MRTNRALLLMSAATVLFSSQAIAQPVPVGQQTTSNQAGPGGPRQRRPLPKIINLQVLPKDTPAEEVIRIMRGFEGQLGVECKFCHTPDEKTHRLNFASDAKPEKAAARIMMGMTHEINSRYLKQLPEMHHEHGEEGEEHAEHEEHGEHDDHPAHVTCGSCHRGHAHPEAFVPPPDEEHEEGPHNQHQMPPTPQN